MGEWGGELGVAVVVINWSRQGIQLAGGATRNRTELDGFAIRYITTLPLRRKC